MRENMEKAKVRAKDAEEEITARSREELGETQRKLQLKNSVQQIEKHRSKKVANLPMPASTTIETKQSTQSLPSVKRSGVEYYDTKCPNSVTILPRDYVVTRHHNESRA